MFYLISIYLILHGQLSLPLPLPLSLPPHNNCHNHGDFCSANICNAIFISHNLMNKHPINPEIAMSSGVVSLVQCGLAAKPSLVEHTRYHGDPFDAVLSPVLFWGQRSPCWRGSCARGRVVVEWRLQAQQFFVLAQIRSVPIAFQGHVLHEP